MNQPSVMDEFQKLMGTKWDHGCLKTYARRDLEFEWDGGFT